MSSLDPYLLDADGLDFRHGRHEKFRLHEITLRIPRGQTIGIVGRSGCGKSTLLGLLGLLLRLKGRSSGRILFRPASPVLRALSGDGSIDYASGSTSLLRHVRLRSFGYALQSAFMQRNLTAEHNVVLPLLAAGRTYGDAVREVEALLVGRDSLRRDFDAFRSRRPTQMSPGQCRRLAVLRAVVHRPEVIFADEPFANLDSYNRGEFAKLLQEAQNAGVSTDGGRATLVLVTHEPEIVQAMCDGIFVIEEGTLHACHDGGGGLPIPRDVFCQENWLDARLKPRWDEGAVVVGGTAL